MIIYISYTVKSCLLSNNIILYRENEENASQDMIVAYLYLNNSDML